MRNGLLHIYITSVDLGISLDLFDKIAIHSESKYLALRRQQQPPLLTQADEFAYPNTTQNRSSQINDLPTPHTKQPRIMAQSSTVSSVTRPFSFVTPRPLYTRCTAVQGYFSALPVPPTATIPGSPSQSSYLSP